MMSVDEFLMNVAVEPLRSSRSEIVKRDVVELATRVSKTYKRVIQVRDNFCKWL